MCVGGRGSTVMPVEGRCGGEGESYMGLRSLKGRKSLLLVQAWGLLYSLAEKLFQNVSGDSPMAWHGIFPSIAFDATQ